MRRLVLPAAAVLVACGGTRETPEPTHRWVKLLGTADYVVSVDTANVQRLRDSSYYMYYLNERTAPITGSEGTSTEQVMHGALRCAPLAFKTPHVALRLNGGPVIKQSGVADVDSVLARVWRTPRDGSMDQVMMKLACDLIERRATARPPS